MPVLGVIPARLGSTRLPRKPLQPVGGVPLVVRVAQRVRAHGVVDRLVIATDSPEVEGVIRHAGFEAVLTSPLHPSGTDRVFEVASRSEFAGFDAILNVQGDEPFVSHAALAGALAQLRLGFDLGTVAAPLAAEHHDDLTRVKVMMDPAGRALTFSRSAIPGGTNWLHLGVYAYQRPALERVARHAPIPEEQAQRLEQLRALGLGLRIGVAIVDKPAGPSVDTEADLAEAETHWTLLTEVSR
ncbi:MAG: 3-deoxy-manno-octulosonate cytidylyltransferase [Gemmatimonadales bacterium]